MPKLLLSCDENCVCCNGKFYIRDFGAILINRYLEVFDSVRIVFRTKYVNNESELGIYNVPVDSRIEVFPVYYFVGPKEFIPNSFKIIRQNRNVTKGCDYAILRLPSVTAFGAIFNIWKTKLPYAIENVFDCYDAIVSSPLQEKPIWSLLYLFQRMANFKSRGVSCVTEYYLQKRYYSKRKDALYSHYSSIEMPDDFLYKSRNYPHQENIRIIHVANQVQFNSRKGHNEVIEVIYNLVKHGYDVSAIFVGKDYQNGVAQLKQFAQSFKIKERINFTGFLNLRELHAELQNADIAILPTKAEGLPRVLIEAMAMGLPCVSTHISGNSELIEDKYLLDYNDVQGFTDRIVNLLSNQNEYIRVSKLNYEKSKHYATSYLNPIRTKFYKQLISKQ